MYFFQEIDCFDLQNVFLPWIPRLLLSGGMLIGCVSGSRMLCLCASGMDRLLRKFAMVFIFFWMGCGV